MPKECMRECSSPPHHYRAGISSFPLLIACSDSKSHSIRAASRPIVPVQAAVAVAVLPFVTTGSVGFGSSLGAVSVTPSV